MKILSLALISLFLNFQARAADDDDLKEFRKADAPLLGHRGYIRCETYSTNDGTPGITIKRIGKDKIEEVDDQFVEKEDHSKVYVKLKLKTKIGDVSESSTSVPDSASSHEKYLEINELCNKQNAVPEDP